LYGVDNVSTTGGVVADVVVGDERIVLTVVFSNPRFGIALSRIILYNKGWYESGGVDYCSVPMYAFQEICFLSSKSTTLVLSRL